LSNEAEPPALSNDINLSTASRSDLEDLRRDLKAAEARAATLMPRAIVLNKAERDRVETCALSLHARKDIVGSFLDDVNKRHAETTALTSRMLSARADYYRAYEGYVGILAGLQGRQWSVHIPAATHGGPLQCRGPGRDSCRKACRRIARRKKTAHVVASRVGSSSPKVND
jgi:hypothetical protein